MKSLSCDQPFSSKFDGFQKWVQEAEGSDWIFLLAAKNLPNTDVSIDRYAHGNVNFLDILESLREEVGDEKFILGVRSMLERRLRR